MDFFNYKKDELESSSGNTQKEYDVVSEDNSDESTRESVSPEPYDQSVNDKYDEDEIEYDDSESDSEVSNNEVSDIIVMTKELEILKLKESIQVYKNRIVMNDMEHFNKMSNLINFTDPQLVKMSIFYNINKTVFITKETEDLENYYYYNTMLKAGVAGMSILGGYLGILIANYCKY